MKIIFDSEEQKNEFLDELVNNGCPGYKPGLDKARNAYDCDGTERCRDCWQKAVEMEVKKHE